LHLLDLLDLQSSPTVLPSSISIPVETMARPTKHTKSICLGGRGGSRTRVQKSFYPKELQQYRYYTAYYLVRLCFWIKETKY